MKKTGFYPGEIMLPRRGFESWSVVACDQFTSQPEYWEKVEAIAKGVPSAAHLIFPEAYLGKVDFEKKIASINRNMEALSQSDVLETYPNAMIYVERTLKNGSVRKGLMGLLDLEEYDYAKGSQTLIRATEGTVTERIPPRVRIRENAPMELPHILILIDDPEKEVVEKASQRKDAYKKLYDFELMLGGGNIKGYLLDAAEKERVEEALVKLQTPASFEARYGITGKPVLFYAVGDGNHSLATAKECYRRIKASLPEEEALRHPARYALVELGNLHDDSLVFEGVHRILTGVDPKAFREEMKAHFAGKEGPYPSQRFTLVLPDGEEEILIPHPENTLAVGSVQSFLDQYLAQNGGEIDYIHGEEVVRSLVEGKQDAVGILLDAMKKEDLFPTVILEGALPRKTFSMGEASEKRYYLECRRIKP